MERDSPPAAVLVVQPSRLGDVLLSTTLLDDLHRAFPDARLDFLTRPNALPLLERHPLVARRLEYTSQTLRDVRAIRAGRYDWVIDPHGGSGSAQRTLLSGARVRVGFAVRLPRRLAYTHTLPRSGPVPRYTADHRKGLVEMLGVPVTHSRPRIFLSDDERDAGRRAMHAIGVPADKPVLGMSITGATTRQSWPLESAARVAQDAFAAGWQPVAFAAPNDARATGLARLAPRAIVAPPRELRAFLAMIPSCTVFASGDTGPAHFAMALGVPTVTLYSKGRSAIWNPRAPDTLVLEAPPDLPCPACELPKRASDDAEHACVASITVEAWTDSISRARAMR